MYIWVNGEIYEGEWTAGMRNGKGVWKGNSGNNVYVGDWK